METKNFCVGKYAGELLTTGHHNILIGENAGRDLTSESYYFIIAGITHKIKDDFEYDRIIMDIKNLINMFDWNKNNGNNHIGFWSQFVNTTGSSSTALGISSLSRADGVKNCDCKEPCNANTCIGRRIL